MDNEIYLRMLGLSTKGFQCAQILIILALEYDEEENQGLVRSLGGLNLGLSNMCGPCGALSGACCVISYFAGKGDEVEVEHPAFKDMLAEFSAWFRENSGSQICTEILGGDIGKMSERCPGIIEASYHKVMEILHRNDAL